MLNLFRARTLQRYVLREFLLTLGITILVCMMLLLAGVMLSESSQYESFGLNTSTLLWLSPFLLPKTLVIALPLAIMLSATLVFGRLSAENEIIAAQAGGVPMRILTLPILIMGVLATGVSLWCNQTGIRWGYQTIRNEIVKVDKQDFFKQLEVPGKSVKFETGQNNVIVINWLPWETDAQTGEVRKPLHVAYFRDQRLGESIYARHYTAEYEGVVGSERLVILTLHDMQVLGASPAFFKKIVREIKLPSPASLIEIGETRGQKGWLDNYNTAQQVRTSLKNRNRFILDRAAEYGGHLLAASPADPASTIFAADGWNQVRIASEAIHGAGGARDRIRGEEAEAFSKVASSVLPLSMVFFGIGLGLLVQRSQRLIGLIIGLLAFALLYYPLMIASKELARSGSVGEYALFLPNIVIFAAGYLLIYRYERGASLSLPSAVSAAGELLWRGLSAVIRGLGALGTGVMPLFFRRRTDGYVAGSFIGPLLAVTIAIALILTAMDLVNNIQEVIDAIAKCSDPLPGMPARTTGQALLDAGAYYCIHTLENILNFLPYLVLIAALLTIYTFVRNSEHLILKSSGVSLQRAFRPILILALLVSALSGVARETLLPELILTRDDLRPLVFRRFPAPTSFALHALDAAGNPVLFEMSQYSSSQRTGRNLRIHQLSGGSRIPMITADTATWNGTGWTLKSEVLREARKKRGEEHAPLAPSNLTAPGREVRNPRDRDRQDTLLTVEVLNHGYLVRTVAVDPGGDVNRVTEPLRIVRTPVETWDGFVTPAVLESRRLGNGVLRLNELREAARLKPELEVERWSRLSEWIMGLVLVLLCVPFMVSEKHGQLFEVSVVLLVVVAYTIASVSIGGWARDGALPPFTPLAVHGTALLAGVVNYWFRMET